MTEESREDLFANNMFGNTELRKTWNRSMSWSTDKPWWADDTFEYNYPGPIPVQEVIDHLFYWEPVEGELTVRIPVPDLDVADGMADDGTYYRNMIVPDRKAIIRPDTAEVLGVFKSGYQIHERKEWFLKGVANLLDDDGLNISSAHQFRKGAVSVICLELPEDMEIPGAGALRPCLVVCTSSDGSLATTYMITLLRPECDNSFKVAVQGAASKMKYKHTSGSLRHVGSARDALGLVYKAGEDAEKWFAELADVDVTDAKFRQIVHALVPIPDPIVEKGKVSNQRSITMAENKQHDLANLWTIDRRAAPWRGTLAGAFHAVNTWHEQVNTHADNHIERQLMGSLDGTFDKADAAFWNVVQGLDIKVPVLV